MTTDEAREALLWFAWFVRKSRGTIEEVTQRALEQYPYLRWDEREAAIRAEGLDVERLAQVDRILTRRYHESPHSWTWDEFAAEYARLAKDAER